VQLDPKTGKRLTPDAPLSSLAYNESIEASCLYKHDAYYYLFVNWGSCCRGVNSTYNIRVGRSRKVTGPYIDKDGVDMLKGGGTLLLSSKGPLFGPGHAGILIDNGKRWFTSDFEGDTRIGGKATLAVMPLTWKSGWPEVEVVDK
jgi:arabinan endo-1,5-alpha-L-arabinosidase